MLCGCILSLYPLSLHLKQNIPLLLLCNQNLHHIFKQPIHEIFKQGVAITGRNTTGPPLHAAPWWVTMHMCRCYIQRQTTTTDEWDDRRQRPSLVWRCYTMCRWASNSSPPNESQSSVRLTFYLPPPHRKWCDVVFLPASVDIYVYQRRYVYGVCTMHVCMFVNNFLAQIQVRLSSNFVSHANGHRGRGD